MASDNEEILGGYHLINMTITSPVKLYYPFEIRGFSSDESNAPHTFKVYINNELAYTINSQNYTFSTTHTITDASLGGEEIDISVECECNSCTKPIYGNGRSITIENVTLAESIYRAYDLLMALVSDDRASSNPIPVDGFTSLIEKVRDI